MSSGGTYTSAHGPNNSGRLHVPPCWFSMARWRLWMGLSDSPNSKWPTTSFWTLLRNKPSDVSWFLPFRMKILKRLTHRG